MFGEHVRRQIPCSAGLSVTVLFYASLILALYPIATCNVQISEFCVLASVSGNKGGKAEARHTRGKVGIYRIQNTPGITTGEKEHFRILLRCKVLGEAYRRGVANGIEKVLFGPMNGMGHLCRNLEFNEGAVYRSPGLYSASPHLPAITVILAGTPSQGSAIPTAASATPTPHDGSVFEANSQQEVAQAAFTVRIPSVAPLSLYLHHTRLAQNATTSCLVRVPLHI